MEFHILFLFSLAVFAYNSQVVQAQLQECQEKSLMIISKFSKGIVYHFSKVFHAKIFYFIVLTCFFFQFALIILN